MEQYSNIVGVGDSDYIRKGHYAAMVVIKVTGILTGLKLWDRKRLRH